MIEILQGETLAFALSGEPEGFAKYEVRAALRPSGVSFRRDCSCGDTILSWDHIDIIGGAAVWSLTTEQSASLPLGKYAMEVALRDIETQQDIKDTTIEIINVKTSYTK